MGADQFSLPHLGAQARSLLDRIVGSGAAGVDRVEADDWVLSRLIELRYVEPSARDDTAFVSTPAGRHRWQIEVLADEERAASALRRQLIRHRLEERFTRLGIATSTALTTGCSQAEPQLQYSVPTLWDPPPQTKMRLSPALATVFAASAVALLVISANTEPQDVRDWLFPPASHAVPVPAPQPIPNTEQTVPVGTLAAAAVAAPVNPLTPEASGRAAKSADASQKQENRAEQDVAASPWDKTIRIVAVTAAAMVGAAGKKSGHIASDITAAVARGFSSTAAALIDSAARDSGQLATAAITGVEGSVKSIAAVLPHPLADVATIVSARELLAQQLRDTAPVPVHREQPVVLQSAFASQPEIEPARPAVDLAAPIEPVAAKAPAARGSKANVDRQHAAVERLNRISLAAARRGEAWQPTGRSDVAATARSP